MPVMGRSCAFSLREIVTPAGRRRTRQSVTLTVESFSQTATETGNTRIPGRSPLPSRRPDMKCHPCTRHNPQGTSIGLSLASISTAQNCTGRLLPHRSQSSDPGQRLEPGSACDPMGVALGLLRPVGAVALTHFPSQTPGRRVFPALGVVCIVPLVASQAASSARWTTAISPARCPGQIGEPNFGLAPGGNCGRGNVEFPRRNCCGKGKSTEGWLGDEGSPERSALFIEKARADRLRWREV